MSRKTRVKGRWNSMIHTKASPWKIWPRSRVDQGTSSYTWGLLRQIAHARAASRSRERRRQGARGDASARAPKCVPALTCLQRSVATRNLPAYTVGT